MTHIRLVTVAAGIQTRHKDNPSILYLFSAPFPPGVSFYSRFTLIVMSELFSDRAVHFCINCCNRTLSVAKCRILIPLDFKSYSDSHGRLNGLQSTPHTQQHTS